jgi:conjugal transfer pilus assembly protein TraE
VNYGRFVETWRHTQLTNRVLFISQVLLATSVLTLAYRNFSHDTAVVLVPPTLAEKTEIQRHDSSLEYRESWAMWAAQFLGNVDPDNVDFVRKAIGPLLYSGIYNDVMKVMEDQVGDIKTDRVTLTFVPHEVSYEPASDKIFVTGRSTIAGASGNQQTDEKTFEFRISIDDYNPLIRWISSYSGEPRTQAVLHQLQAQKGAP